MRRQQQKTTIKIIHDRNYSNTEYLYSVRHAGCVG